MSINVVCISGNLTRDAEIRKTKTGLAVCYFSVAVNERRRNPNTEEWEDYANFLDCIVYGKHGEALQPYLVKGAKICVQGSLRWSSWEKDGQKRSKVEIIASEVELPPKPKQGASGDSVAADVYSADIPF